MRSIVLLALICTVALIAAGRAVAGPLSPVSPRQPVVATPRITTPTPTRPQYLVPTPTTVPTPEPEIVPAYDDPDSGYEYLVREGDTILSVALETGLDLDAAYCLVAPTFDRAEPLVVGVSIHIPTYPFACHQIEPGEELSDIANAYGVLPSAILAEDWNALPAGRPAASLQPGTYLRIPLADGLVMVSNPDADQGFLPLMLSQPVGTAPDLVRVVGVAMSEYDLPAVGGPGSLYSEPVPADWPYGSGAFAWPMFGWLTQDFHGNHRAIDIAAPAGTLVTAADRGVVIRAGWNLSGYGFFVIVDHNIDYLTLYAHLSDVLVEEGQIVAKGEALGRVGSTGNSSGPHLHFEIRDFGRRTDPIPLLIE